MEPQRRDLRLGSDAAVGMRPARAEGHGGRRPGWLVAIGGAEDRVQHRLVLRRFVELSGGPSAKLVLLTAASQDGPATWKGYEGVFRALGVRRLCWVDARGPAEADAHGLAMRLARADGVFITGGDQRRLMASIGGRAFERALLLAFRRGACIAGTSAGAAALSRHMLAEGAAPYLPEKDAARLERGLGLVPNAILDQHFSERRRLGRLLSALAQQPDLLGVGIDEDTALVIGRGRGVEVVGHGTVTLLDGSRMRSNHAQAKPGEKLELQGVRLHLLSAGTRYRVGQEDAGPAAVSASLREAVPRLVDCAPSRRCGAAEPSRGTAVVRALRPD